MAALAALLLLLQAAVAPRPADQPKATLRGHVYVVDNGAPLKRAQVTLSGAGRREQSVTSDAQGGFEFRDVEAGSYSMTCSKAGYIQSTYGQRGMGRAPTPLVVLAGQQLKDLDFRLARSGVISGVVTDDDGEPIRRVQVIAFVRASWRGQSQLQQRASANTDDRGQYRLFDLPPGRYYVQALHRGTWFTGGGNLGYSLVFYPNAATVEDAQRVEVANGGEVSGIDLMMRQVPTYSVSGKVFDTVSGKPVSGGTVTAGVYLAHMSWGGGAVFVLPGGAFRITGLTAGTYQLNFTLPGRHGDTGRDAIRLTQSIEIVSGDINDLLVNVGPGGTVRGRITADGGTPPERLHVTLISKSGGRYGANSAPVNKDLTFEIPNVQQGDYDLSVGPVPYESRPAPYYVREVRNRGENIVDRGLTVTEGVVAAEIEIVLDFRPGSISGHAADEDGNPLPDAVVVLVNANPKLRASDRYFQRAFIGSDGSFRLRTLIPGDYFALIWPGSDANQILDPDVWILLEKHASHVRIERGSTTTQDLKIVGEVKALALKLAEQQ